MSSQVKHTPLTDLAPHNTDILLKDSIYAAIGLAAPVLENELDFGRFLESTLVTEVQYQQPGYNILRRRIAIVLGQWLGVEEGLDRPLVYQVFQFLLDKEDKLNDVVVRVTAGRQLKNVIDPFDFVPESFMPFLPTLLSRLMPLTEEVDLSETKLALLNTVSIIVVRMEHHVNIIKPGATLLLMMRRLAPLQTRSCLYCQHFGAKQAMNFSSSNPFSVYCLL